MNHVHFYLELSPKPWHAYLGVSHLYLPQMEGCHTHTNTARSGANSCARQTPFALFGQPACCCNSKAKHNMHMHMYVHKHKHTPHPSSLEISHDALRAPCFMRLSSDWWMNHIHFHLGVSLAESETRQKQYFIDTDLIQALLTCLSHFWFPLQ